MKITVFSVLMAIQWSSALTILFSLLRKNRKLLDICGVSGVIFLYLVCAVRLLIPIEVPWVRVIPSSHIYVPIYRFLMSPILGDGFGKIIGVPVSRYHFLVLVWGIVAFSLLVRLWIRYWRMSRWINSLENIKDDRLEDLLCQVEAEEKRQLKINIIKSREVRMPFSTGIIHKKIIVPAELLREKDLYFVVKHEYMHLKNQDLLIQLLVNVICALYWWNPFIYLLRRNLEHDFEVQSDQLVANGLSRNEVADYLETLVYIFRTGQEVNISGTGGAGLFGESKGNREKLLERFEILADGGKKTGKRQGLFVAFLLAIAVSMCSYSFIFQSCFEPEQAEIEEGRSDTHYVDGTNCLVIHKRNGEYVAVMEFAGMKAEEIISRETADMMHQDIGVRIIDEDNKGKTSGNQK